MGYGLLNLLFVYMVFSLMLAVFNLVYLRQLKRERRHRENARRLLQAGRTRLRKALTEKGTRAERRRIRRFSMARYLGRFEEELKEVAAYDPALVRAYFQKYEAEYMMLIVPIQKMGVTEKTMYARLVMKYGINADQKSAAFAAAMIRLMDRSSMFLMYNVLGGFGGHGHAGGVERRAESHDRTRFLLLQQSDHERADVVCRLAKRAAFASFEKPKRVQSGNPLRAAGIRAEGKRAVQAGYFADFGKWKRKS